MTDFKYPIGSLRGDYLRAAIGLFVTVGLLVAATKITIFQFPPPARQDRRRRWAIAARGT